MAHPSPYAPNVYSNGEPVLTDVSYTTISSYPSLPAGTQRVAVYAKGDPSIPAIDAPAPDTGVSACLPLDGGPGIRALRSRGAGTNGVSAPHERSARNVKRTSRLVCSHHNVFRRPGSYAGFPTLSHLQEAPSRRR